MNDINIFKNNPFFKKYFDESKSNGKRGENTKGMVAKFYIAFFHSQPTVSLENSVGDDENSTYRDIIKSENSDIEESIILRERSERLKVLLKKYVTNERNYKILIYFIGLGSNLEVKCTLDNIGKEYNMSKERIRQIINNECKKLKNVPELFQFFKEFF